MTKSYVTIKVPHARTYDSTELRVTSSSEKRSGSAFRKTDTQLQNELGWQNEDKTTRRIITALESLIHKTENPSASIASSCLLSSKSLPLHLNLPIEDPSPPSILQQSLFLRQGFAPVLLTVYDKTKLKGEDRSHVHDYAVKVVQMHYRLLLSYCCCDFVVLPCTIEVTELHWQRIQEEIEKQKENTRAYYSGPYDLTEEVYASLKNGVLLLSAGTFACCLLEEDEPEKPWILVMDEEQRQDVYALISKNVSRPSPVTLRLELHATHERKVAILETAIRLALWKEVIVHTSDQLMGKKISQISQLLKDRPGLENLRCKKLSTYTLSHATVHTDDDTLGKQRKHEESKYSQLAADKDTVGTDEKDQEDLAQKTRLLIKDAKVAQSKLRRLISEFDAVYQERLLKFQQRESMASVSQSPPNRVQKERSATNVLAGTLSKKLNGSLVIPEKMRRNYLAKQD